jgi:AhpD family alkylhydroperoxidase
MPSPSYRPKPCIDCGCMVHPRSSQTKRCPACAVAHRRKLWRDREQRIAPVPASRFMCVDCMCLCAREKGSRQIRCATCDAELDRQRARGWAKAHPERRLAQRIKGRAYASTYNREYRTRNRIRLQEYNREAYAKNPLPFLSRTRRYKQSIRASEFV